MSRDERIREAAPDMHRALTNLLQFLDTCLISGSHDLIAEGKKALKKANKRK